MTNSRQRAAKASDFGQLMVAKETYVRPRPEQVFSFVNRRLLTKNELERVKSGGHVFLKEADGFWSVAVYVSESNVVNSFQADSELVAMIDAELRRQAMSTVIVSHLDECIEPPTAPARRRRMAV